MTCGFNKVQIIMDHGLLTSFKNAISRFEYVGVPSGDLANVFLSYYFSFIDDFEPTHDYFLPRVKQLK